MVVVRAVVVVEAQAHRVVAVRAIVGLGMWALRVIAAVVAAEVWAPSVVVLAATTGVVGVGHASEAVEVEVHVRVGVDG